MTRPCDDCERSHGPHYTGCRCRIQRLPDVFPASRYYLTRIADGARLGRMTLDAPLAFGPPAFAYTFVRITAEKLAAQHDDYSPVRIDRA